jgi:hypothetical protein
MGAIYMVVRLCWPKQEAVDGRWKPPAIICANSYFERGAGDGPAKNRKKWESGGNTSRVLSGRNPAS